MLNKSALIAAIALLDTSCTLHRMEIKRVAEEDISVFPILAPAIESDNCSLTLTNVSEKKKSWVVCKNWNKLSPHIPFQPCEQYRVAEMVNEPLFLPLNRQAFNVLSK